MCLRFGGRGKRFFQYRHDDCVVPLSLSNAAFFSKAQAVIECDGAVVKGEYAQRYPMQPQFVKSKRQ
ncbi:hypothetical protein SAMN04488112_1012 [Melghirimyces thermohalophilus]|uniref:Uncharacterized protein n=1 Tax=Melghirimyces thermohalophilus TaxID=1236220 RepID=A0A1G6HJS3_9BACL|nr:hypothetical protein SAMN04488112_1012 [Melghirimyces thermohalophilus]